MPGEPVFASNAQNVNVWRCNLIMGMLHYIRIHLSKLKTEKPTRQDELALEPKMGLWLSASKSFGSELYTCRVMHCANGLKILRMYLTSTMLQPERQKRPKEALRSSKITDLHYLKPMRWLGRNQKLIYCS